VKKYLVGRKTGEVGVSQHGLPNQRGSRRSANFGSSGPFNPTNSLATTDPPPSCFEESTGPSQRQTTHPSSYNTMAGLVNTARLSARVAGRYANNHVARRGEILF